MPPTVLVLTLMDGFGFGVLRGMACAETKIPVSVPKQPLPRVMMMATTRGFPFQRRWCCRLFRRILRPRWTRRTPWWMASHSRPSIFWTHPCITSKQDKRTVSKSSWPCTSATASTMQAWSATTSARTMNLNDFQASSRISWRNSRCSCWGVGSTWSSKRTKMRSRRSSNNTTRSKWTSCRSPPRRWVDQLAQEEQPTHWLARKRAKRQSQLSWEVRSQPRSRSSTCFASSASSSWIRPFHSFLWNS